MDLLAGASFASGVVYFFLAGVFVFLAIRRRFFGPAKGEKRLTARAHACFAGGGLSIAAFALCHAMHLHEKDPAESADWALRALYFPLVGGAFTTMAACIYGEVGTPWRLRLVPPIAVASVLVAVALRMGWLTSTHIDARVLGGGVLRYVDYSYTPRPAMLLAEVCGMVVLFVIATIVVRAYLEGKGEALIASLGAFASGACVLSDMLVLNDVYRGVLVSHVGLMALAFGLSYALLARHARVSEEISVRSAEIERRSSQLRKAYDELARAQDQLLDREQLAAVGELAAVVSHEVRNPLAIIRNAVAALRKPNFAPEDRSSLLGILDEEVDRLSRLASDLSRYAKPHTFERQLLDVHALLARALELGAGYANVRLVVQSEPSEPSEPSEKKRLALPEVHGDADMLRQVLDNLVQNACQAMPEGGTLSARIVASVEGGLEGVSIEIADTGEGMDTAVRSRARTPFFTTRAEGTGLGLALCERIVTAHGGILSITSKAREGTVVAVFLPTRGVKTASAQERPSEA